MKTGDRICYLDVPSPRKNHLHNRDTRMSLPITYLLIHGPECPTFGCAATFKRLLERGMSRLGFYVPMSSEADGSSESGNGQFGTRVYQAAKKNPRTSHLFSKI